jgi:hypothetical protein
MQLKNYHNLKLQLDGFLKPGEQHKRNVLLESVYGSLPKDAEANVLVFSAEIAPDGYTSWHCHNSGTLVKAKAGDVYSEPIAKFHRGYNPHPDLAYSCIGLCLTSPDRDHITNVTERPW